MTATEVHSNKERSSRVLEIFIGFYLSWIFSSSPAQHKAPRIHLANARFNESQQQSRHELIRSLSRLLATLTRLKKSIIQILINLSRLKGHKREN